MNACLLMVNQHVPACHVTSFMPKHRSTCHRPPGRSSPRCHSRYNLPDTVPYREAPGNGEDVVGDMWYFSFSFNCKAKISLQWNYSVSYNIFCRHLFVVGIDRRGYLSWGSSSLYSSRETFHWMLEFDCLATSTSVFHCFQTIVLGTWPQLI